MTVKARNNESYPAAAAFAVFAAALIIAFLAFRGGDIGRLPQLAANLAGGPLLGDFTNSLVGLIIGAFILQAWIGLGRQVFRFIGPAMSADVSVFLMIAIFAALGAGVWSVIWFFAGLAGGYTAATAIVCLIVGNILLGVPGAPSTTDPSLRKNWWKGNSTADWVLVGIGAVPVLLALFAALAPPIAKDTLLYHFSVPKAFIVQGGNALIEGNIASYLALGAEMHTVWAMLLGSIYTPAAGEAAAGAVTFLFFPLLLVATYGVSREFGVSRRFSLIATLMVACVPTAFHVASSGYIDLALALFVTLAILALCRWWTSGENGWLALLAIFLGAALSIKLTAVFVIAAFALVILLRARNAENSGRVLAGGFAALFLAGVIALPWYLRTWMATGSPVFPFYMSIWRGEAAGWDVERSNLFQGMNSQYGGADVNALNYIIAPIRVSVVAQPEQPVNYDGVLGVAFLIGLPILIWALWKYDLPVEAKIGAGVAGIMYLFWLFSSSQLRYLLPILPMLAVAIAASAEIISGHRAVLKRVWKYSIIAAAAACILTTTAWFFEKAPLRVVLGGETREDYLTRNLDYYPFYQAVNNDTSPDSRIWLINMRRDTYHIERPVISDYLFEDWTLRKMVWESRSTPELKAKSAALGIEYILARHDFLFDYDRSTLVDDKRPRSDNEAKLRMARELILDPANTIKADGKFSLVKVFSE